MKGLIVKSPWIDLILEGKKTWEIRGTKTNKRGKVGLIKSGSGLVIGTVDILDCIKLSLAEYQKSSTYHCIESEKCSSLPYKNTYAWVLKNPKTLDVPKPYEHPKGAIIWVNLSNSSQHF